MAQVLSYMAGLSLGDSNNNLADVSWRVNQTMYDAYDGAIDAATRAATPLGELMAAIAALSSCNVFERRVSKLIKEDTAIFPADALGIWNFDKISVSLKGGVDNYSLTIPGRKLSAYAVGMVDGVINIAVGTRTAEVDAFIVAVANGMLTKNGSQPIVQKMYVNR